MSVGFMMCAKSGYVLRQNSVFSLWFVYADSIDCGLCHLGIPLLKHLDNIIVALFLLRYTIYIYIYIL